MNSRKLRNVSQREIADLRAALDGHAIVANTLLSIVRLSLDLAASAAARLKE
jgi:hypothetical protein